MNCKKIIFKTSEQEYEERPSVVYGIILEETETHLRFKTAKKEYYVSKQYILSCIDTDIIFYEDEVN